MQSPSSVSDRPQDGMTAYTDVGGGLDAQGLEEKQGEYDQRAKPDRLLAVLGSGLGRRTEHSTQRT